MMQSFYRNQHYMLRLQYKTFWLQNLWGTIIFVPMLLAVFILVNFYEAWHYSSNVILDNTEFNISIFIVIIMGGFSFLLSFKVTWVKALRYVSNCIGHLDDATIDEGYTRKDKSDKPTSVWTTQTFAARKKVEKTSRKIDAGITPRVPRKAIKKSAENTLFLKENIVVPSPRQDICGSSASSECNVKLICSNTPPKRLIKPCNSLEHSVTNFATHRGLGENTNPDKTLLMRICGGFIFIAVVFMMAITPMVIYHVAKPNSPYVYYKPDCHNTANHTKIVKV